MEVQGSIALVTGANRGLGKAFAQALLAAGARKVYAGARNPESITNPDFSAIKLDITNPEDIKKAAELCQDVNILINNAGVQSSNQVLASPSMHPGRQEMEVNYFGTLATCRAFAPLLKRNGGGALVIMNSIVSLYPHPMNSTYGVSRAATMALTNAARIELRAQGTLVVGIYASIIDTDMAKDLPPPKISPEEVATQTIEALKTDREEVYADEQTRTRRELLRTDPQAVAREMQQEWDTYSPLLNLQP
jgi:NAD(P)-dependent dehydrogenase (short-subunit alcohol dehydrogenase family)